MISPTPIFQSKPKGAIIGSMERILIFICLLTNNFGTIGFVLAAKSVARFKKLEEQEAFAI